MKTKQPLPIGLIIKTVHPKGRIKNNPGRGLLRFSFHFYVQKKVSYRKSNLKLLAFSYYWASTAGVQKQKYSTEYLSARKKLSSDTSMEEIHQT